METSDRECYVEVREQGEESVNAYRVPAERVISGIHTARKTHHMVGLSLEADEDREEREA